MSEEEFKTKQAPSVPTKTKQTKQAAMCFENISSNDQNQEILEIKRVEKFGRKSLKNKDTVVCFSIEQNKIQMLFKDL